MWGFGARGRRNQLCDFVRDFSIDIVCLQETFRSSFSSADLDSIGGAGRFGWR